MARKPVVLCILDGWGLRAERMANAPALADTPTFDRLLATCPNATLTTHGRDVGLPDGQMGNSEVGHTNIGAGRVVAMDLGRIDAAVADGSFAANPTLGAFTATVGAAGGTAHLIGIVSDGGVHGHIDHVVAAAEAVAAAGVPVAVHAITDGRDVAPTSAAGFVADLARRLPAGARIATVVGRYYAMDRDRRWDRVAAAYRAIVAGDGETAADAEAAVAAASDRGETDEFVAPTVVGAHAGVADGDGVFCLNFRADRAREILAAIGDPAFDGFDPGRRPRLSAMLGMVAYSEDHRRYMDTVFEKQVIADTLGAWVATHGLTQYRLAETEKYPHVTFFLDGGAEAGQPGEERCMPASPKVATYDQAPEMSAGEVTAKLVAAIRAGHDLIVVNYANPDMVGHTGDLDAAIRACAAVDRGLAAATQAVEAAGGAMVVTADHGNCEVMVDPETGRPHTAHTLSPVPVIVLGAPEGAGLRDGRLADLAPTVLELMGLARPEAMTGHSLIAR